MKRGRWTENQREGENQTTNAAMLGVSLGFVQGRDFRAVFILAELLSVRVQQRPLKSVTWEAGTPVRNTETWTSLWGTDGTGDTLEKSVVDCL